MLTQKDEKNTPSYSLALMTALVVWAILFGVHRYLDQDVLFGDTYSHVLYWQDLRKGVEAAVSPTITTPKPLAIIVQGWSWEEWGGSLGVVYAWMTVASLMAFLICLIGHRVYSAAAGILGVALFLSWPEAQKIIFEGRASLLAGLGLVFAIERVSARGCFSWGAAPGVIFAGLVRPEAWFLGAFLVIAGMVARIRKSSEPSVMLAPSLATLCAPIVWMGFDHLVFSDFLFSRSVTELWNDVLGDRVAELSLSTILIGSGIWLSVAVDRLGFGFLLAFLVGVWLARGRRFKPLGWMPLSMLVWILVILVVGALGLTAAHRFLDPIWLCVWPFVGGTFAAALALVPFREAPARKTYLAIIGILILAKGASDLRDHKSIIRRLDDTTVEMIGAIAEIETANPGGRWLIDNDVASRAVLEAGLDRHEVRTLQAAGPEEIRAERWEGLVLDDRLYPRHRGTPQDEAIGKLIKTGKNEFTAPGCLVIRVLPETK